MGLCPDVFWGLTPWQFSLYCEAYKERIEADHNMRAWMMWHGAGLSRSKKLLPLKDFLFTEKKQSKGIDESAIMARLKAYSKRYKEEHNGGQT